MGIATLGLSASCLGLIGHLGYYIPRPSSYLGLSSLGLLPLALTHLGLHARVIRPSHPVGLPSFGPHPPKSSQPGPIHLGLPDLGLHPPTSSQPMPIHLGLPNLGLPLSTQVFPTWTYIQRSLPNLGLHPPRSSQAGLTSVYVFPTSAYSPRSSEPGPTSVYVFPT